MEKIGYLYIKLMTGKTLSLSGIFNISTTVLELKQIIQNKEGIPPEKQRLIFEGQSLQFPERRLVDYHIRHESTIHVVLCSGNYDKEFKEFKQLMMNYKKIEIQKHEKKIDITPILGIYGPMVHILEYVEVLELLYSISRINKHFQQNVFDILSRKVILINQSHVNCLLGRLKHIPESYLLKLLRNGILDETTTDSHHLNLLQICCRWNYFKAFKYLIDERNWKFGDEKRKENISSFAPFEFTDFLRKRGVLGSVDVDIHTITNFLQNKNGIKPLLNLISYKIGEVNINEILQGIERNMNPKYHNSFPRIFSKFENWKKLENSITGINNIYKDFSVFRDKLYLFETPLIKYFLSIKENIRKKSFKKL